MVKTIRASVLILVLACSAQAGYIQNGSPEPPPPSQPTGYMPNGSPETPAQPTNTAQEPPTGGDMQNGVAASVTEITLSLLAGLPSVF